MANIKGILFDKDGTLIEFTGLWKAIAKGLVEELVDPHNFLLKEKLLGKIGLINDEVSPTSILASGTTKDIADAFRQVLLDEHVIFPEPLYSWIELKILELTKQNIHAVKPAANLKPLFDRLKEKGLRMGVATADDQETTLLTLDLLGLTHYFDFIGTSDRYEKKPHPHMMEAFCEVVGLSVEEVVMVGDTSVDIAFARNARCQYVIGVHSGAGQNKDLQGADFLIPSIDDLVDSKRRFIWERAVSI
ncbi:HAD family hydrolase [Bacillus coreaensis]